MRKDPSLILSDTYLMLTKLLGGESGDSEDKRALLFNGILSSYEGYDIIEAICREAAVLTGYDWVGRGQDATTPPRHADFLNRVIQSEQKYGSSRDWPRIETRRAEAFFNYVRTL